MKLIYASEKEVVIQHGSLATLLPGTSLSGDMSIVSIRYQCYARSKYWSEPHIRDALSLLPERPPSLSELPDPPVITGVEYLYPSGEIECLAAKKAFSEDENVENCNRLSMAITNKDEIKKIMSFVIDDDMIFQNTVSAADPVAWGWAYFAIGESRKLALSQMRASHYMGRVYNGPAELHDRVTALYPGARRVRTIQIPWRTFNWAERLSCLASSEGRTFGDLSAVGDPTAIVFKSFWFGGVENFRQIILNSAEKGEKIIISDLLRGPCARSAYISHIEPILLDSIPLACSRAKSFFARERKRKSKLFPPYGISREVFNRGISVDKFWIEATGGKRIPMTWEYMENTCSKLRAW